MAGLLLPQPTLWRARRNPAVLCDAVAPSSHVIFQTLAGILRHPPVVGDDRDAGRNVHSATTAAATAGCWSTRQELQEGRVAHDEGVPDARQLLDFIDIRIDHASAEHRALLIDRVQHAGRIDVDAEAGLSGNDREVVDTREEACR